MRVGYVVIRFYSPFHVGRYGLYDTYDYVPSDTIYAALEKLSRETGLERPVRVSSAYPVLQSGGRPELRLGVPFPATWKLDLLREASEKGLPLKDVRALRFMPLACLKGGRLAVELVEAKRGIRVVCMAGSDEVDVALWNEGLGQRVALTRNRLSRNLQNADPFRTAAFMPRVPYVVYYAGGDPRLFELLGLLGLGGERSVGLGKFKIIEQGDVDLPAGGREAVLLGVGRPVKYEAALGEWAVRGWRCTEGTVGPLSVLLDGGVVRGDFEFENVERVDKPCSRMLAPLWAWLS